MTARPPQPASLFSRVGEHRLRQILWTFYARATADDLLGPVFTRQLGPFPSAGWPVHLARLEGFWRAVTGGPGAYRGQPGPAHAGHGIAPDHFDRWLGLWDTTVHDALPLPEADALLALARRMRPTLERFTTVPPEESTRDP